MWGVNDRTPRAECVKSGGPVCSGEVGVSTGSLGILARALLLRASPRGHHMGMPLRVPTYTTEDLRAFPEDGQRYELLEGMLLVTPMPGSAHQVVLARLLAALDRYLSTAERAFVVSPGEIEIAPKTLLEPDLLVFPATYPPGTPWREMRGWWLAAEVFSPSSRVYDRDFKRDAYLALGVEEVWLVDLDERAVLVSRRGGERDVREAERVVWRPAGMTGEAVEIELASLFRGMA